MDIDIKVPHLDTGGSQADSLAEDGLQPHGFLLLGVPRVFPWHRHCHMQACLHVVPSLRKQLYVDNEVSSIYH